MTHFKTIGILGGLGPAAGVYFHKLLIDLNTEAVTDQDHPPVIHYANSQIESRMDYLIRGGPSPIPEIIRSFNVLKAAGADFAVMICNTAHLFLPQIRPFVDLKIVSLIDETAKYVHTHYPHQPIGILATTPTLEHHIYGHIFKEPSLSDQNLVMEAIFNPEYGLKRFPSGTTPSIQQLTSVISRLDTPLVLAACTELSPVLVSTNSYQIIDPLKITAEILLRKAATHNHKLSQ